MKLIELPILTTSFIHLFLNASENLYYELGSERVKVMLLAYVNYGVPENPKGGLQLKWEGGVGWVASGTLFALETAVESLSYHGNLLFEELDLLFIGVLQHLEVVHHNP